MDGMRYFLLSITFVAVAVLGFVALLGLEKFAGG
jgi:hypothetical protein